MKNFIKILILEILIICLIFSYLLIKDSGIVAVENFENTLSEAVYEKVNEIAINKSEIYSKIEEALLEGEEYVEFKNLSLLLKADDIFNILDTVVYENPKIMYYKGAEYQFGKLRIHYTKSKEEIKEHQAEIEKIREDFISKYITEDMSDYEKELAAHDYIINNCRYDTNLLENKTIPPESYTAYGVLKMGVGVCEGYAKAMKFLLDGLGIDSLIVVGQSKGENHAWNLVKLDDGYYHVDVTWDDPVIDDGQDIIRYNFFNLNDSEISKTHTWNKENYPPATGRKYNYFVYNDLIVKSESELENKIKNAILNKKSEVLYRLENINEKIDIKSLIESIAYQNFNRVKLKKYSYTIDKEQGIINLKFIY